MSKRLPLLLGGLLLIAACQDQSTTAPDLPDDVEPPTAAPPSTDILTGKVEGYPEPGEVRTGFILGRDGNPMEITYEIHDGLAIWEGDIVVGKADEIAASAEDLLRKPRGGARFGVYIDGSSFRWSGGVVPYEIASDLPNQSRVTNAIAWVEEATAGVTLVPRDGESDYVEFVTGSGCSSAIGRQSGRQTINLANACSTGNTAHEILHALGMFHEHTRCDRDDYVVINFDKIEAGKEGNFDKNCDGATDFDVYDAGSIMHYPPDAFSTDGSNTIEAKAGSGISESDMGQRSALGPTDITTINHLYGSNNQSPTAAIAALAASYPEGSSVAFDGSGSSDLDDEVLLYSWTFGDGTCTGGSPPAECSTESPSHTYADNGSYAVTLTVSDGPTGISGFLSDDASATATIVNVAPVVAAGPDATVDEASLFSDNSGTFADPGADTWTATVDYGDGSGPQPLSLSGKSFDLTHTYADDGVYTITIEVTDDDGGVGSDQVEVTVNNLPPTITGFTVTPLEIIVGQSANASDEFTDVPADVADLVATLDWGDGNSETVPSGFDLDHTYVASGDYDVELEVDDQDGGITTEVRPLTVLSPAEAIDALDGQVTGLGLPDGTENSLLSKLRNAGKSVDKGNSTPAINQLESFIAEVEAQRGSRISDADAGALVAVAQAIIDALEAGLS